MIIIYVALMSPSINKTKIKIGMYTINDKAFINQQRPYGVPSTLYDEEEDLERSFFILEKIQSRSFFMIVLCYCLRSLANISDDELSKELK